jgi:hypothetical protein
MPRAVACRAPGSRIITAMSRKARAFKTSCQEETYWKVRGLLDELVDEHFDDAEHCDFYVKFGTTVVEISIDPFDDDNAVVEVLAFCAQGVEPTAELMRELLELNAGISLGAFSLVGNDVYFSHTFIGRGLSAEELIASLTSVAAISDEYDEQIVAKYGGETALDRLRTFSRRTLTAERRN